MAINYTVDPVTGELAEYVFDIGGLLALRNFDVRTVGNRLIIQSAENENFTVLDALVNEVAIDGVVYDDVTTAQQALKRLVFNPNTPVILTQEQQQILENLQNIKNKGLQDDSNLVLTRDVAKLYEVPDDCLLYGIILNGTAMVEVSSTSTETDKGNLGEIEGSAGDILNFMMMTNRTVFFTASNNVEITPIIYKR